MQVIIKDTGDLRAVNKVLRRAANGKELRLALTRGIREELKPIAAQVKAAYLARPSRNPNPRLRRNLARVTRVEVRTGGKQAGARIRVDGRKMPDGMRALQKYYEGTVRWRHPVFGNREVWVTQEAHPTFYPTVQPHGPRIERKVNELASDVVNRIVRK